MIDRKLWLTMAPIALLLTGAPVAAQDAQAEGASVPFEEADSNSDGGLDSDEFRSALYSSVDTDGSATLEEQEYAHGQRMFKEVDLSKYDADDSGSLDEKEFEQSYLEEASFEDSDADADGMISSDEYLAMFNGY
ncbi:hypothetical protein [Aurantimonas sp. HBX-1]|uniref:hypothetical protein n=1 Tax=Aurantimonas sp. HBX-1 TaxID=2906072 RepID=UPI001F2CF5CF|nr:hypothetical protein [Aurantimonas sp. HBX-1]UIJ73331.1 hypothetical protein LXB15_06725 [Aurantimonas sp. HBX-1]